MPPPPSISDLADRLESLRDSIVSTSTDEAIALQQVHPRNVASADNLLDYLALRSSDLRDLQSDLAHHGLSSLGRAEAHVEATLQGVCRAANALAGLPEPRFDPPMVSFDEGPAQLETNAELLFGPRPPHRTARIMVTLPPEGATDAGIVAEFAGAGASVFRINSAHDGPQAWAAMVGHVRAAEARTGRRLVVVVDLAGPKLRTGPIAPGPKVVKFKPQRDALGRTTVPAEVVLVAGAPGEPTAPGDTTAPSVADDPSEPRHSAPGTESLPAGPLPVTDRAWLARRAVGDVVEFVDSRGSHRTLTVRGTHGSRVECVLTDTAYFVPGLALQVADDRTTVADLPATVQRLRIHPGDHLRLVADLTPADPSATPPTIGCTLPEAFRDTAVGDRVWLDDGKIGGRIIATDDVALEIEVTSIAAQGAWLGAEKGINLPDTDLDLAALTEEDRAVLPFVVAHADAVDLSFVRTAADVADLRDELDRLGRPDFPVIVKLETMTGFRNLPDILLAGMASPHLGVMIARGDLAVEGGYARMGEIQEEIMWICEASHVPVVWATQVLEDLAKTGTPARAEVTDAAMSGRAECVMLNKGPHIPTAIRFLDAILTRMEGHQDKKSSLLRRLRLSARGSEL
ncbi:pyruvate kinase [Raineyella antarctica]|uniref:pyruvate kinase n=1 Tax=Raineyella antarctica TaxID=1577474 RepID=A0A1G6HG08_9ACTN|nr:pyruvate kinase [Raineyella antarctica]SDB93182.1 pyruvate kinase [Raineyella antarctica]